MGDAGGWVTSGVVLKVVAALAVLLAAVGLSGCAGGGGSEAGPTSTAAPSGDRPAPACGAPVPPPPLDDALASLRDDLTAAAGLPRAPAFDTYRMGCDNLDATRAPVPGGWDDTLPGPGDPPQAGFTAGPDLTSRVEDEPVVGVGAARYVGDPPAASFVNANNARGSLENGARTLPRRGDAIDEGCTALDPVPYESTDGAYVGEVAPFVDCDGEARVWLVAAGFPAAEGQYQTQLIGQALTTADLDALVRVLGATEVDAAHVPPAAVPPLPPVTAP